MDFIGENTVEDFALLDLFFSSHLVKLLIPSSDCFSKVVEGLERWRGLANSNSFLLTARQKSLESKKFLKFHSGCLNKLSQQCRLQLLPNLP